MMVLRNKVDSKEVLVVGSGGIEKNTDLIPCHRRGNELEPDWSLELIEAEAIKV